MCWCMVRSLSNRKPRFLTWSEKEIALLPRRTEEGRVEGSTDGGEN